MVEMVAVVRPRGPETSCLAGCACSRRRVLGNPTRICSRPRADIRSTRLRNRLEQRSSSHSQRDCHCEPGSHHHCYRSLLGWRPCGRNRDSAAGKVALCRGQRRDPLPPQLASQLWQMEVFPPTRPLPQLLPPTRLHPLVPALVIRPLPPPPPPPPSPPPSPPPPVPCPAECAELGSNGVCDVMCNITTCLWDTGECGDVLENVLRLSTPGGDLDRVKVGSALSKTLAKDAVYGGIGIGVLLGVGLVVGALYVRRRRRLAEMQNRKYTPYGDTVDEFGGIEAPKPANPDTPDVIT
mmetsp:Transcript_4287/g.11861  ORF Transcript_4287/g.11861 Transcript_4287/m.11861 type:complete len:295 (+) Transcript_4287:421-1305(+)